MKIFSYLTTFCLLNMSTLAIASNDQIFPLLLQRHSGRNYEANKPVTQSQIVALAEAAQNAPSCYNDQPWHFIFCNKLTEESSYNKVLDSLVEFNQNWAKNAPLLVVVATDTEFRHSKKQNPWGPYDAGAAAVSLALQATSMGLMAHQMAGFDEQKIKKSFQIPDRYQPCSVIAVGFEVGADAARQAIKERRPLQENFFSGEWGKGLKKN